MSSRALKYFWIAAILLFILVLAIKMGQGLWGWKAAPVFLRHVKNVEEEIVIIKLMRQQEKIVLEKKNGAWRLSSPEDYSVDEPSVQAMIEAAASAVVEERVTRRAEKHGELAVDQDHAIALSLKTAAGKTAVAGAIGKQLLGSWDRSYFKFDGKNDVYIIKGLPRYQFDKSLRELKSKKILEAPQGQIASIAVEHGKKYFLLKRSGENWLVNSRPAKTEAALNIVHVFTLLEANDFAGAEELGQGLKALGLGGKPKEARVKIALVNGQNFELWIGAKKDTLYFAKLAGQTSIWKLADWKVSPLKVTESDLKASKKSS
ncbi:MAG: DUF4340 domain-containing protein [Elusimicrobia bacterium]|nr:DUF4340 domain-containing protein [Elusimicrobiota bacterium]